MQARKEDALLKAIHTLASNKGSCCIIRPIDLLMLIPYKVEFKQSDLETILTNLEMDGYIENVITDKKGDAYYCITVLKKGQAYMRTLEVERRKKRDKILFRIALVVGGTILGFILRYYILPLILK